MSQNKKDVVKVIDENGEATTRSKMFCYLRIKDVQQKLLDLHRQHCPESTLSVYRPGYILRRPTVLIKAVYKITKFLIAVRMKRLLVAAHPERKASLTVEQRVTLFNVCAIRLERVARLKERFPTADIVSACKGGYKSYILTRLLCVGALSNWPVLSAADCGHPACWGKEEYMTKDGAKERIMLTTHESFAAQQAIHNMQPHVVLLDIDFVENMEFRVRNASQSSYWKGLGSATLFICVVKRDYTGVGEVKVQLHYDLYTGVDPGRELSVPRVSLHHRVYKITPITAVIMFFAEKDLAQARARETSVDKISVQLPNAIGSQTTPAQLIRKPNTRGPPVETVDPTIKGCVLQQPMYCPKMHLLSLLLPLLVLPLLLPLLLPLPRLPL
ncbi:hypothetical protein B484DRAFT_405090 [Ochromonadaceae sp. CCMP2298]|nr:hypothetical protein B484DRAFT_405090 [Ochromonadaceae sp. CCMP2298]